MLECIDLYCGAGGLSLGLSLSGVRVRASVDLSEDCERTYKFNFKDDVFIRSDLRNVSGEDLKGRLKKADEFLLAGGPPCQLFSRLNRMGADRIDGLKPYIRLIKELEPAYVVFENVPNIVNRGVAWGYLMNSFARLRYKVSVNIVKAVKYGVPQVRERAIVLAARERIELRDGNSRTKNVREAIGHLPDSDLNIPNHITLKLSEANLSRIQMLRPGGKSRQTGTSFSDSYARMSWQMPSPTITTKCISFSNGRFGHPEYDRGITIREAASLQGFPEDFRFFGSLWSCARQVGNAVPPAVARVIGDTILEHHARKSRRRRKVVS
jgi:DNA (cytosine-5)-methyltransferase 1